MITLLFLDLSYLINLLSFLSCKNFQRSLKNVNHAHSEIYSLFFIIFRISFKVIRIALKTRDPAHAYLFCPFLTCLLCSKHHIIIPQVCFSCHQNLLMVSGNFLSILMVGLTLQISTFILPFLRNHT